VSVTAARGFAAAGVASGIKPTGALDLALVVTDPVRPVPAAATFTTNLAAAAPVVVSRAHLQRTGGRAAAVVLNSGCANAATGAGGRADAELMCDLAAKELQVAGEDVLVCSTGLIGIPLPPGRLEVGIPDLVASRGATLHASVRAATAILTTDTHRKQVVIPGAAFTVGGMAKGAAMLAPNMATMLVVLTTDAAVGPPELAASLQTAVAGSFNELTVDGCTSTNDTVVVLASGEAATPPPAALTDALTAACADLAGQMAADAEGMTKVVRVTVRGAESPAQAARAARRVAESQLVKCSFYGADPYWGRVVSELGTAGVSFDIERVSVAYGDVTVCRAGAAVGHDAQALARHMAGRELELSCDLGLGDGSASVLTTDLSHAYIDENMRTS
jgi:glutamate N-acetyltransferase/amino-acid N-acetyltransferase